MQELNAYNELRSALESLVVLSEQEWAFFRDAFIVRVVESKTIIAREGDVAKEIYFVCSGLARLFYQTKDSDQITAFIFTENMFASCLESFIKQQPSIQNLETIEPCTLLVLSKDKLDILYDQVPKSHVIMRKVMEARFIASQQLLSAYILAGPQERYELFAQRHPHLIKRVPQYILASFLGITPVSLSRIRKRIARQV